VERPSKRASVDVQMLKIINFVVTDVLRTGAGLAAAKADLHAAVQEGKDHEDGGRVAQVRAVGVRAGRARAWNAPP
jgi:hypothetical protein